MIFVVRSECQSKKSIHAEIVLTVGMDCDGEVIELYNTIKVKSKIQYMVREERRE